MYFTPHLSRREARWGAPHHDVRRAIEPGADRVIYWHRHLHREVCPMRLALVALLVIVTGSFVETAKADPYRWCAEYGGSGQGGGGTNCFTL